MKLVTVTNKNMINTFKALKDVRLVYPLNSFCIGYDLTFAITEIDDFVLINTMLTDDDLDTLEALLKDSHIKGIIFDDLGLLEVIKDLKVEKILILDHYLNNSRSVNYYLDYVDSVVVSSDITKEEIETITKNAKKSVVILVLGLKKLMYSRRKLLTNYMTYHELDLKNTIDAAILDKTFLIKENEKGTVFFMGKPYNALDLLNMPNVLYYWYDLPLEDTSEFEKILKDGKVSFITTRGFLDTPSEFKVKGDKNG